LCGSFLKEPRDYWWQRLQRAVDGGADVALLLGAGTAHQQGQTMEARTPEQRDANADKLLRLAGPAPVSELLTAKEAGQLPSIGFHTVRHHSLPRPDDGQLAQS